MLLLPKSFHHCPGIQPDNSSGYFSFFHSFFRSTFTFEMISHLAGLPFRSYYSRVACVYSGASLKSLPLPKELKKETPITIIIK